MCPQMFTNSPSSAEKQPSRSTLTATHNNITCSLMAVVIIIAAMEEISLGTINSDTAT